MASPFEELRARALVSTQKALALQAANRLHGRELDLRRVLGIRLDSDVTVEGALVYIPFQGDLDDAIADAQRGRRDLLAAEAGIEALELQLAATRAELFPKVYGFFNAGWKKPSSKTFGGTEGGEYWNAGLSVSLPIFDGFSTHGKLLKAHAGLRQSRWKCADLQDEILLQVRKSFLNIRDAARFVEVTRENLELAKEGRRLAQVGYDNGVNTQLDLLEADSALSQAKYGHLQAVFGHIIARAGLVYATGAMLRTFADFGPKKLK
jgi:outer membrane protein